MSQIHKSQLPLREINTPLARELAECLLIQSDLRSCLSGLALYKKIIAETGGPIVAPEDQRIIMAALFRDAVVQFVACFEKRKHALSVKDVYVGFTGADAYFKWLRDLRNSYAAHAYGAARQCKVGALVDPAKGYTGIGNLMAVFQGMYDVDVPQLLQFFTVAAHYNDKRTDGVTRKLDDAARALPIIDLLAAPLVEIVAPDSAQLVQSRGSLKVDQPPKTE